MEIIRKILVIILTFVIVLIVAGFVYAGAMYLEVQKEVQNGKIEIKISEIMSRKNYVSKATMSEQYRKTVVAVEDKRFYEHGPVDPLSIARAITNNYNKKKLAEGGSTITQQVVKNVFLDQKKDISRKVKEAFLARELEKRYTKETILDVYVNASYFGKGYYGIEEASKGYFGKNPSELSTVEAAFLAGVPNAPSVYNPYADKELALKRRNIVLDKMAEANIITKEEAEKLKSEDIKVKQKEEGKIEKIDRY